VEKLFIVPLKVPLALNDAGKLMEFRIVSLGRKSLTSFAVDTSSLYQNQNTLSVSGKPVMDPLPTIVVLPMPLLYLGSGFRSICQIFCRLPDSILVVLKRKRIG
jgi:hypothetical protein